MEAKKPTAPPAHEAAPVQTKEEHHAETVKASLKQVEDDHAHRLAQSRETFKVLRADHDKLRDDADRLKAIITEMKAQIAKVSDVLAKEHAPYANPH
jgi:predicted RNase H-like nuclease (RuvC/YqgF family)